MIFRSISNDDGEWGLELDAEGIEYLEDGLHALKGREPGEGVQSPSLTEDGDTNEPEGVSNFVLMRAADDPTA